MKIAVIGATGQLGSDFVKVFGEEAIPITHKELDVVNMSDLKILKDISPDVIINTAAFHKVDRCEDEPEKTFKVNALGARNVAIVNRDIDAINVYISTDYVFDGKKMKPYIEEDKVSPLNVYGVSKVAGEIFTRTISSKYYILRVASLFGVAGASGKGGNFIETMINKAKAGENIKVIDDMIMSPTYTRHVAEIFKKMLGKELPYGTYHVVNSGYCSWYELTKEIFKILDWEINVTPISSTDFKRKAIVPKFSALSNEKIKKNNIKIKSWKEALKEYLMEKKYI